MKNSGPGKLSRIGFRSSLLTVAGLLSGVVVSLAYSHTIDTAALRGNSPLEAYVGFSRNPAMQARDEAQYDREENQRQILIKNCMASEGFQYTPRESSVLVTDTMAADDVAALTSDPDAEYLKGLTAAERIRYDVALTGSDRPNDPTAGVVPGSCVASAHSKLPGVYAARSALTEELVDLERSIRTDKQVLAAKDDWASCMIGKGLKVPTDLTLSPRAVVDSGVRMSEQDLTAYLAESDVCAVRAGLAEVEETRRRAAERDFIVRHSDVLVKRP